MRARDTREYIEPVCREFIENLMKEVRKELQEDYMLFAKVRSHYVKIRVSDTTPYTRGYLDWDLHARSLFGKSLRKLTAIASAIYSLRLVLKDLGYELKP